MKADMSIFIFIIVAVVLAGAVLVMGMGGIGQVGASLQGMLGLGEQVKAEFTPKDIRSVCQTWLSAGAKKNDPETIFNLGVSDAFKPYPRFWDSCGDPLSALVTVCKSGSDTCPDAIINKNAYAVGRELGRTFGKVTGDDIIACCVNSCGIAIKEYDQCSLTSNSEAELVTCFDNAMADERPNKC